MRCATILVMQTIRRVREGEPLPDGTVQIVGYEDSLTGRWYLVLVRVPDSPSRLGWPPIHVWAKTETTTVQGPQWSGLVGATGEAIAA